MSRLGEMCSGVSSTVQKDIALFNRWISKSVSTEECIRQFLANNRRKVKRYEDRYGRLEDDPITEKEFEEWMRSIGWTRRTN